MQASPGDPGCLVSTRAHGLAHCFVDNRYAESLPDK